MDTGHTPSCPLSMCVRVHSNNVVFDSACISSAGDTLVSSSSAVPPIVRHALLMKRWAFFFYISLISVVLGSGSLMMLGRTANLDSEIILLPNPQL